MNFKATPRNKTLHRFLLATFLALAATTAVLAPPLRAQAKADPHIKPGTDYPHWEAFTGYSFFEARAGLSESEFNAHGGSATLTYNADRTFGIALDLGGYHGGNIAGRNVDAIGYSILIGPQVNWRGGNKTNLYVRMLFGDMHGNADFVPALVSQDRFALAAGLGFDVGLARHIAWRAVQAEYFVSDFDSPTGYRPQNNVRISSGLLFRWGYHPVIVNQIPSATCSVDKSSVVARTGEAVPVHVQTNDADGDPLSYAWSSSGGRVDGTGADARWESTDLAPNTYTITAHVDDGHGGMASCMSEVRVEAPPRRLPTVACSAQRPSVLPGERVTITANATNPEGSNLEYIWRANAGQIVGAGATLQLDTTGLSPATYTVTLRIQDAFGGAADCATAITVAAPPPPPQATKLNECSFPSMNSSRVDNVCKRILDDVALRLQSEPRARVVIIGYSDPRERNAGILAQDRATNALTYLGEHSVESNRATLRSGSGQPGAGEMNRRIEVIWVPEGATY